MYTKQQLYKFGVYSERAHRLAMDIAMQSALLGEKGLAVIADETRGIGIKLCNAVDECFNTEECNLRLEDEIKSLAALALNGAIEMLHVSGFANHHLPTLPIAVIMDEIRLLTVELMNLLGYTPPQSYVMPVVNPVSPVVGVDIFCLIMRVNGIELFENVRYISEVARQPHIQYGSSSETDNSVLLLRGQRIPILKFNKKAEVTSEHEYFVIVNTDYCGEDGSYALPVDTLPELFRSKVGMSTSYSGDFTSSFYRECWNCEEGRQMLFCDYRKIIP